MVKMKRLQHLKKYTLLHTGILFYSFSPVFAKLAAGSPVFSLRFAICYGISLLILSVYALLWQQIIRQLPLTTAFSNKAMTVVWGIVWGVLIFGESITPGKLIGAVLVITGVVLFAGADGEVGNP